MTSQIPINQFRTLVNKRDTPYYYGDPDDLNKKPQQLVINYTTEPVYALLDESIYESDPDNFIQIMYGPSLDNLTELDASDYTVDYNNAVVSFNTLPDQSLKYYAYYKGGGSIIWAQDVTSLQEVARNIDSNTVYKDGSVTLTGDLDLGEHNIRNVNFVDGINIPVHKHDGSDNDCQPLNSDGLENDAVITVKIADQNVTSQKIADGAIVTEKISNGAVTTDKIANSAVVNYKIANQTITANKIANKTLTFSQFSETVLATILNTIYPINSLYISLTNTCPLEGVSGQHWEKVAEAENRVLQVSSNEHVAGTTIDAGLPNHTHGIGRQTTRNNGNFVWNNTNDTSYKLGSTAGYIRWNGSGNDNTQVRLTPGSNIGSLGSNFTQCTTLAKTDSIESDGVFGKANTVQPAAYIVNIFRRVS